MKYMESERKEGKTKKREKMGERKSMRVKRKKETEEERERKKSGTLREKYKHKKDNK